MGSPKLPSSMEIDPSPPLQAISGEKDEWPDLPDTTRQPPSSPLQLDLDKTIEENEKIDTQQQHHCQNPSQQPDTNQMVHDNDDEVEEKRVNDVQMKIEESLDERIPINGEPIPPFEPSETLKNLYQENPNSKDDFVLESGAVKLSHFVGAELIRCFIRIFVSSKRDELTFTNVSRNQCAAFDRLTLDYPILQSTQKVEEETPGQVIIVLKKSLS